MKIGQIVAGAIGIVLVAAAAAYFLAGPKPPPPAAEPSAAAAEAQSAAAPAAPKGRAALEGAVAGEWTMDLDAAKALAAETGLPLFLNFTGSDWCGWCRMMDKQVFSQEAWKTYAKKNFVLVWIDFPRDKSLVPDAFAERNAKLMQEFGVGGFPTYVLLDSDGHTRLGQAGASRDATPERFIAELDDALLASDKSIAALKEKLADEQKAELDAAREAKDLARQKLEDWIGTDPESNDENNAAFEAMRDEIQRADAAFLGLLKSLK
ncbi:MAG: thioredoxin family protein [Kiritimatiellia bacterium]